MNEFDYIMKTYNRFPVVLTKGEGMYVSDDKGKEYLDFVAGIAVNLLGHGHKGLAEAISKQAETLIHVSNLYWTKPQLSLAKKLVENSCFDKVFFCNSGAEAIEGALKLSRKYGNGRYEIICMENSFHGRTYGAVSSTGQKKYQAGFEPLLPGIVHVPYNDFEALKKAVTPKTCAVLLEPIQGEGGIKPAEKEFLQDVRKLCTEKDLVLIFDEIQCGVGRSGYLFAYEYFDVKPDVVTLAKGLAGGVPIGALLATDKVASAFAPGDHASTFGGNPLATAAADYVINQLLGGLLDNVKIQGKYLFEKLTALKERFPIITDVRGIGLMLGIELSEPCSSIVSKCLEDGLLLVSSGTNVIRFVPPFILTKEDIDKAIEILASAFNDM